MEKMGNEKFVPKLAESDVTSEKGGRWKIKATEACFTRHCCIVEEKGENTLDNALKTRIHKRHREIKWHSLIIRVSFIYRESEIRRGRHGQLACKSFDSFFHSAVSQGGSIWDARICINGGEFQRV